MGAVHRSSCHSNEVRNLHQRITLRIGCTRWAKGQEFFDALGLGSYLFGGLDSLSLYLQAGGAQVSAHLLMLLPYIFTILVLWFATSRVVKARVGAPAALGLPYAREEKH